MSAKAGILCALFALAVVFASSRARASDESAYALDSRGRSVRIAFDPGHRLEIGAAWAPALEGNAPDARRFALSGGLSIRHRVDFEEEAIRWNLTHRLARGAFTFGSQNAVTGELYTLDFLRWSEDGALVLPTSPPKRLAFPLGLGFEVGLGNVDLLVGEGARGEVGVARGTLLFDVIRSRSHGKYLTLGAGPRYAVRVDSTTGDVEHVVAPFSQPEIAGRVELGRGHHVLAAGGGGGWAWTSEGRGGTQARANASYELVLAAVNDAPIALRTEATFRYDDPPLPGREKAELRGTVGLVLGLPLRGGAR